MCSLNIAAKISETLCHPVSNCPFICVRLSRHRPVKRTEKEITDKLKMYFEVLYWTWYNATNVHGYVSLMFTMLNFTA